MDNIEDELPSSSYFLSSLTTDDTLSDTSAFFYNLDPKLHYFAAGLTILYAAFFIMILADIRFFWPLDQLQLKMDYYVNLVKKKIRRVELDQKRLISLEERADIETKRSLKGQRVVDALRGALQDEDAEGILKLTSQINSEAFSEKSWFGDSGEATEDDYND